MRNKPGDIEESLGIPYPIKKAIIVSVLGSTYVAFLSCYMSDPFQVCLAIASGMFSFAAMLGKRSKTKILVGSLLSSLLYFVSHPIVNAVLVGFLQAYLQTATEIYVSNLALKPFRSSAVELMNILFTMQTCMIFFFLIFATGTSLVNSLPFMLGVMLLQIGGVFFLIPTPPIEISSTAPDKNSMLYGSVYKKLVALYDKAPFSCFHAEYAEIVDVHNGKRPSFRAQAWAVLEKVNVSFITVALEGILSVETRNSSANLVVFTATTMFVWIYARCVPEKQLEMSMLSLGIMLLIMIRIAYVDPVFVLAMAGSIYLVPSEEGFLAQNAGVISYANSLRAVLATIAFYFLNRKPFA
ncbi:hypothetical protein NECID01_0027 [Nematocida sp. AWRm77]|nr:hypothetical protein NECID01_0027 [Nematocida sp. AWRm77]